MGRTATSPSRSPQTLALGVGVGLVNGVLVNYLRIAPFIATFGVYYILTGIAFTWSVQPIGLASPSFYNLYINTWAGVPALLVMMGVFWSACWYVARQTAFGKHLYALGGDREASRLAGFARPGSASAPMSSARP